MKIGLISDVHANLPALDAVLGDLHDVDKIVHVGDIVGYNAFPNQVIQRFQQKRIDSITGNHDQAVVGDGRFDFPDPAAEVIDWTANELSDKNLEFINQLPAQLQLEIDGYSLQVVHSSPFKADEYIYPTDLTLDLVERLDDAVDVLIWGHTHYPVITKINDVLLLNPGSVGQPRDGDWRTCYAIFDTHTGNVELRRREYDANLTVEKAKSEHLPPQVIASLRRPD